MGATEGAVEWSRSDPIRVEVSTEWTYASVMQTGTTQVVERVAALLRAASAHEPQGATTTALGHASGIPRASAHRLLCSLEDQGLVERTAQGRWLLGPDVYFLGTAAGPRYDVTDQARVVLMSLTQRTGESAFLSARRGGQTVCLASEEGSFPLRSHVLHEGVRFPLGVASAGLVILSHLDDREVDEYLGGADLSAWGGEHGADRIRHRVAATRRTGYAENPGLVVAGSWGMGAAVFDSGGKPSWALSLTGVEARFGDERRPALGRLLLDAAHELTRVLSGRAGSTVVRPQTPSTAATT